MEHINTQLDNLYTFIKNVEYKAKLQAKLNKIEAEIERLDKHIEQFEKLGLEPFVDFLTEDRNRLNLERIQINLKLIEVEKELLVFEFEAATRD
jgi:cell division protein FtsB